MIWGGLHAFWNGGSPYASSGYFYPVPFTLLAAPLGALPQGIGFLLILALALVLGVLAYRKRFIYWLPFTPVLYHLFGGNVDLIFVAAAHFIRPNRRGALLAALLTLKPQLALILLPYFLMEFARHDRRLLATWGAYIALLWGIPTLLYPVLTQAWLTGLLGGEWGHTGINTPSLWAFSWMSPLVSVGIALMSLVILLRCNWHREVQCRTALMCIVPIGHFYGTVALMECAPALLLIPVSVAAAYLAERTALPIWFSLIPLSALIWRIWDSIQHKKTEGLTLSRSIAHV